MPEASSGSIAIAPTRHTGMLLGGGTLVLLGGLCLVTGMSLRGWRTPAGGLALGFGMLLTLTGFLVIYLQLVQGT